MNKDPSVYSLAWSLPQPLISAYGPSSLSQVDYYKTDQNHLKEISEAAQVHTETPRVYTNA